MYSRSERVKAERPPCPKCKMNMIALRGLRLDLERKTFEGHVEQPKKADKGPCSSPSIPSR